jgi:hypothetical protein
LGVWCELSREAKRTRLARVFWGGIRFYLVSKYHFLVRDLIGRKSSKMTECEVCGKKLFMPFQCNFCGRYFCNEHRLPENHDCAFAPERSPLGSYETKQRIANEKKTKTGMVSEGDFQTRRETEDTERHRRHLNTSRIIRVIVACSIVIVILSGFAYAYLNNLNAFNQTKSDLESLGYAISNNVSGMDISTFIKAASVVPMVDLTSLVSVARQYNITTIYEKGLSFYVVTVYLLIVITAYKYTPSHSIWWIWGELPD